MGPYLAGGDHDADLLDGLGKLFGLDHSVVVQVEVLEGLEEDALLGLRAAGLLRQLLLKLFLETAP